MKTVKKLKIKDKNGDIYEFAGGGGGSADSVSYTNGAKPEWDSVEKALNGIIDKIDYVDPKITNFTMSPAVAEYEIGQSVTNLSFSWAYNKDITTQSLSDCSLSSATERSATWSGDLRSNKTFTLSNNSSIFIGFTIQSSAPKRNPSFLSAIVDFAVTNNIGIV